MGQEEVPGHVEAGGDGRAEQEGGGLEQGGAEAASINLRKNLDGTEPCVLITGSLIPFALTLAIKICGIACINELLQKTSSSYRAPKKYVRRRWILRTTFRLSRSNLILKG